MQKSVKSSRKLTWAQIFFFCESLWDTRINDLRVCCLYYFSSFISLYSNVSCYIFTWLCMCVCVCAGVRFWVAVPGGVLGVNGCLGGVVDKKKPDSTGNGALAEMTFALMLNVPFPARGGGTGDLRKACEFPWVPVWLRLKGLENKSIRPLQRNKHGKKTSNENKYQSGEKAGSDIWSYQSKSGWVAVCR